MPIDLKKLFASEKSTDSKSRNALLKALKENAVKDFDYLKYRHSVSALKDMDIDDEKAFKSAYATASTMGLSKSALIGSAKKYLGILDREHRHFAEALKNQLDGRVDKKKAELKKYNQKIEANKRKIEELQEQNRLLAAKIDQVKEDLAGTDSKLRSTNESFQMAFEELSTSIKSDISLIDQYL